ncbi:MAG: di-heme-cytochrome C peroxidase [Gallionella sp.]
MQKLCIRIFYKLGTRLYKILLLLALLIALGFVSLYSSTWSHKIWDNDPDRGAATVTNDLFGDHFDKVVYLNQGWDNKDSLWFYSTTQGSDLIPYDFFIALEQADKSEAFSSTENMNRYRYLPQKPTSSNPDGLPVGLVADIYQGKKYMGFTCAACHTSQINYNGTGIRIDGNQAAADMDSFMKDLESSLKATLNEIAEKDQNGKWKKRNPIGERGKRFIAAVLDRGDYDNEEEILEDLRKFSLRIGTYNFINRSPVKYGYGRLDAFGRIFNRVLQHVVTADEMRTLLRNTLTEEELNTVLPGFEKVLNDQNREHIIEHLVELLTVKQQLALKDKLFNKPTAPVSYPFLWDTPQHDYLQWNGIAANSGEGPIGRNTGEVIGVFGTLDWSEKPGWTISSVIGGQGFGDSHISFKSSVDSHNLRLLESQLAYLQSPSWNDATEKGGLPELDEKRVIRGEPLFDEYCASCHQNIVRDDPDRHVIANFTKLDAVGTDKTMALNAGGTGYAGILTNQYVDMGVGSLYLKDRTYVAALLTKADLNVVATPDPDKWFFQRWADWAHDLFVAYKENTVKASLKMGDYDASTTAAPLAQLMAYKGRSLNGIWATAPYLHNGSVPTLYDLLLPAKKEAGDKPETEYRPAKFITGSREFDDKKVGFKSAGYEGFVFDTGVTNNSNSGHEYGTRKMTPEERLDLLEYLKSL